MALRGLATAGVFGLLLFAAALAAAAAAPFGVGGEASSAPSGEAGVLTFLLSKQAEFYRGLAALIRAAKADGSAVFGLLGLSLAYGIFHAAGPGHGKAVISAYLVANEQTWRRGIALAFVSALLQALVAVVLVAVLAALIGTSAKLMGQTVRSIEIASYALIFALGGTLIFAKVRQFLAVARTAGEPHREPRENGAAAVALSAAAHAHGEHCGHAHGPEPSALAGPGGWQRGLTAVLAVGLRPCSGAILVLVFALAQGLFWAGVASTLVMGLGTAITVAVIASFAVAAKGLAMRFAARRSQHARLLLSLLELLAALAVCLLGALLLVGYLASERLFGF